MKKICFFTFILLIGSFCKAQSIYFNKRISIPGGLEGSRGIVPYKNGYFVAGGFLDVLDTNHLTLSKLDSNGNYKWLQDYRLKGYNYFFGLSGSLFQTEDKCFSICGGRVPVGPKGYGILLKVDSLGIRKWEKEYQFLNYDNGLYSGNDTKDKGYILTGDAQIGSTRYSYLLLKTDSMGNQQWYKTYTDNDPERDYAGQCVIQTPDNGYCIGGYGGYNSYTGIKAVVEVIKTDSLGNMEWKKTYGNPNYSNGGGLICLSKDSCIIATYSITINYISPYEEHKQPYLVKLGLDGSEKWSKRIANVQVSNSASWIKTLEDGNFILSGGHKVKDTMYKKIGWLYKIKSNGDSLWYREYAFLQGYRDVNILSVVAPTPDKGFVGAGTMYPEIGTGEQDVWVFKTDSLGCLVPNCTGIGITEFNPNVGAQMLVYPNPFKEAFAINYSIPKEGKKGVFVLRDVMGRLVYSTPLSNNVKQLQVVASGLKAGMYVASFIVDGVIVSSEKIVKE